MSEATLYSRLHKRKEENAFRQLSMPEGRTDFCSNDYLGIVKNNLLKRLLAEEIGASPGMQDFRTGSTGSRLLSGNYALIAATEREIASFHDAPAGLIYNSGYDANLGLLSCVPQRGDTILYDHLSHASIRDGIRLSQASSFSFRHNDTEDLLRKISSAKGNLFVVTESIFSMDGDQAPLTQLSQICASHGAHLIVDEAHATGVIGQRGEGLVQVLGLSAQVFARIHTFGKACGVHGAIILGSEMLRDYLINFSRPFIYTTALPEAAVAAIAASYRIFPGLQKERCHIQSLIAAFQSARLQYRLQKSDTPVQAVVVPGNSTVKALAGKLQQHGFDVRPILYPTVPEGSERLRIVIHAFNTLDELNALTRQLS